MPTWCYRLGPELLHGLTDSHGLCQASLEMALFTSLEGLFSAPSVSSSIRCPSRATSDRAHRAHILLLPRFSLVKVE
jgi:hypothetical protein